MPSSDPTTIPKVLKLVQHLKPELVLDIGCGNGRYGFLFREILDWNYGRINRDSWITQIDAVEIFKSYLTPIHSYVYNQIYQEDWLNVNEDELLYYDLIFMGDVLEHFRNWKKALDKAKRFARNLIVVAPNWKGSLGQNTWNGNSFEKHEVELSPALVGGKCIFANSKCFISVFGDGEIEGRDLLL